MKAKFGDEINIEIVGVDPDGIPDAIIVEILRDARRVEGQWLSGKDWAALRRCAFEFVCQWFAETENSQP